MRIEKPLHLLDDDGVTELPVISVGQEEAEKLGWTDEDYDDPEPGGLDMFRPDYLVYES